MATSHRMPFNSGTFSIFRTILLKVQVYEHTLRPFAKTEWTDKHGIQRLFIFKWFRTSALSVFKERALGNNAILNCTSVLHDLHPHITRNTFQRIFNKSIGVWRRLQYIIAIGVPTYIHSHYDDNNNPRFCQGIIMKK